MKVEKKYHQKNHISISCIIPNDLERGVDTEKIDKYTSLSIEKTKKNTKIVIDKRRRYCLANFFLRLPTYGYDYPFQLLGRNNPMKEMLETSAALYYIRETIGKLVHSSNSDHKTRSSLINNYLNNSNVLCLIPGDGIMPRTGYLFAIYTKWTVISIDPLMNLDRVNAELNTPENLICLKSKSEDVDLNTYAKDKEDFVIVHVHSHANFDNEWRRLQYISPTGKKIGLTIPCCKKYVQTLSDKVTPFDKFIDDELSELTRTAEIYIYTEGSFDTIPKKLIDVSVNNYESNHI